MARQRFDTAPEFRVADDSVVIQQVAGSSAPLLELKDHSGSALVTVHSTGQMTTTVAPSFVSAALTGTPTAPTASAGTNTTQIATTAFVRTEVSNLIASAPATLDTLDELAAALGDDANFATTVTSALGLKAPLASPTFTGTVTLPSDTSIGSVSSTELGYLDGVTSAIQTQINSKLSTAVTSAVAGTGISVSSSTGTVTFTNTGVTFVSGALNQIMVSNGGVGSISLSIASSPTISGTITAGGYYAVGTLTLNRASATAWNAGANIKLNVDGTTYLNLGVNPTHGSLQSSGSISIPTSTGYAFGDHSFNNYWRPVDQWGNSYFDINAGSFYVDSPNYYLRDASSNMIQEMNASTITFHKDMSIIRWRGALDRAWDNYPSITIYNHQDLGPPWEFRIHGYPGASGGDFSIVVRSDGGYTQGSDVRIKRNIAAIDNALSIVNNISGVRYQRVNRDLEIETHTNIANGVRFGVIAQDCIDLIPECITKSIGAEPLENGWCDEYAVDYAQMTPLLIEAIKELTARIQQLETAA